MDNYDIYLSDITYDSEEERAIAEVLKSKWISMGAVTEAFEQDFREYVGSSHVIAVSNCTAALHLALVSLGIHSGDEVILPSLTFVATANAVRYTGATPVFVDVNSLDDWNISSDDIEKHITDRTSAIIVVHYGGFPCDMKRIKEIAKKNNLFVVEDAAHGPGSWINSKHIGTIGDVGCFSFFSNKNMTTGEGGALVTNNDDIAGKARCLRSHGMTSLSWDRYRGHAYQYDVAALGFNYRFDDLKAALACVQLKKLSSNNRKRAERYDHYRNLLKQIPEVKIPFNNINEKVSYHIFPILLGDNINRNQLMKKMSSFGIQTSVHYPPVHLFSTYSKMYSERLAYTEIIGQRELTLPMHPMLDFKDIDYVVNKLKKCLHK
jgi:dTDP-4-amino-4,6-dideoxygalactose transaminase